MQTLRDPKMTVGSLVTIVLLMVGAWAIFVAVLYWVLSVVG